MSLQIPAGDERRRGGARSGVAWLTCKESNPVSRAQRHIPSTSIVVWNEDESVVIRLPRYEAIPAPPPFSTKSSVALTPSLHVPGGQEQKCSHAFVARRNRWPASEQTNVRAMFDKIVEADRTTVAFERSDATSAEATEVPSRSRRFSVGFCSSEEP